MRPVNKPDSLASQGSEDSAGKATDSGETKQSRGATRWMIEVVVIVAAAIVLALLVQQFIVKPYAIPSPSMENTLLVGDRVLVNRMVYHFHSPRRGDIVVFQPPASVGSKDPFIKRVIGVGGDTVALRDGYMYVNGVRLVEPYVKDYPIKSAPFEEKVKEGYLFVMGDNRNNSDDSRIFHQISIKRQKPPNEDAGYVIGEAFARYWPLNRIGGL